MSDEVSCLNGSEDCEFGDTHELGLVEQIMGGRMQPQRPTSKAVGEIKTKLFVNVAYDIALSIATRLISCHFDGGFVRTDAALNLVGKRCAVL
jgi:hypothetical protein